jgi:hypothetical protein
MFGLKGLGGRSHSYEARPLMNRELEFRLKANEIGVVCADENCLECSNNCRIELRFHTLGQTQPSH